MANEAGSDIDVLPYDKNKALVNVVVSFDQDSIKEFYEGLKENEFKTDVPGVFNFGAESHLVDFAVKIGLYQEEQSGFEYDLTILEVPSASGDYFQARLFEYYLITKRGYFNAAGLEKAPELKGSIDSLPALYMCWGYGKDARTWSTVHKGFINEIDYKFPANGDKVLKIGLKDSLSFSFDAPANTNSVFEATVPINFEESFMFNITDVTSKFLAAALYKCFVVVDLGQDLANYLDAEESRILNNAFSEKEEPAPTEGLEEDPEGAEADATRDRLEAQLDRCEADVKVLEEMRRSREARKESLMAGGAMTGEETAEVNELTEEIAELNSKINEKKNECAYLQKQINTVDQGKSLGTDTKSAETPGGMGQVAVIPNPNVGDEPKELKAFYKHEFDVHRYNMLLGRKPFSGMYTMQLIKNPAKGNQPTNAQPYSEVRDDEGNYQLNKNYSQEQGGDLQDQFDQNHKNDGYFAPYKVFLPSPDYQTTPGSKFHITEPDVFNHHYPEVGVNLGTWHDKSSNTLEETNSMGGDPGAVVQAFDQKSTGDGTRLISVTIQGEHTRKYLHLAMQEEEDIGGDAHNEWDRFLRNMHEGGGYGSDLSYGGYTSTGVGDYQGYGEGGFYHSDAARQQAMKDEQQFYSDRASNQRQQEADAAREASKEHYNLRLVKGAGISVRSFLVGYDRETGYAHNKGLRNKLNNLVVDSVGPDPDSLDKIDMISCNIDTEFIKKADIINSGLETFCYFGIQSRFKEFVETTDDDRYVDDTPYRAIYSLGCTSEAIKDEATGEVDLEPTSKDLVFTYGRPGIPVESHTEPPYRISQQPIITDIDYNLYAWYFWSLFARPMASKASTAFLEEEEIVPKIILTKVIAYTGSAAKFADFMVKWTQATGDAEKAMRKRAETFWSKFVSSENLDTEKYNQAYDPEDPTGKPGEDTVLIKDIEQDANAVALNVAGDAVSDHSDEEKKALMNIIFNMSLAHKNKRVFYSYAKTKESAVIDEPVFAPNYDMNNQVASKNTTIEDALLARQADHYAHISQRMHNLFITVPGIPELSTLSELFGDKPRIIHIQIYNPRVGTSHWLTGDYGLVGMQHTINTRQGFLTRMHLINRGHTRG